MNKFSLEARDELCRVRYDDERCRTAFLSAFVRSAGTLHLGGGKSIALNISDAAAEAVKAAIVGLYPVAVEPCRGGYRIVGEVLGFMLALSLIKLSDDGLIELMKGIDPELIKTDGELRAYLAGAFLGSGSVTSGKTGNSVQFAFSNAIAAESFKRLLSKVGISAGVARRSNREIVYVKKNEHISDLLAAIGANKAMLSFNELLVLRQARMSANRANNIELANMDKTIYAATKQIEDVKKIAASAGGLGKLGEKLEQTARARLECGSEATYEELAAKLGISKGSLKYRLKRLSEIAAAL